MAIQRDNQFALKRPGLAAFRHDRVEAARDEREATIDEIAEAVGEVAVHTFHEARDGEIRIAGLGCVGRKPPAPGVSRQERKRGLFTDAALALLPADTWRWWLA